MTWRDRTSIDEELRVRLILKSQNAKLGAMPVSTSSPSTCPPSCTWYGNGCYAETGYIGGRWKRTVEKGITWAEFIARVYELPKGQIWRHNEAGDLPGRGEEIDVVALDQLVSANRGKLGFTYTHKCASKNQRLIEMANQHGFAISVSCDSLDEVDEHIDRGGKYPLVLVVPEDASRSMRSPKYGVAVVGCPAQWRDTTCLECALCTHINRNFVIAFRAHGYGSKSVSFRSVQKRFTF